MTKATYAILGFTALTSLGTTWLGCSEGTCEENLSCPSDSLSSDAGNGDGSAGKADTSHTSDGAAEMDDGGGAGGSGGSGIQDAGPDAPGGSSDRTSPTVVSISPSNGATGVRQNAPIVITFSEPMNRTATQSAYQSTDLPPAHVTMTWNAAGTVLTITPKAPLVYATGTDPAVVAAKHYAFQLTSAAKDLAGNALAATSSSFQTLRRITQTLSAKGDTFSDSSSAFLCGASANKCTEP